MLPLEHVVVEDLRDDAALRTGDVIVEGLIGGLRREGGVGDRHPQRRVTGELDGVAPALCTRVVVIALIVTILARARREGWEIRVINVTDHYRHIFEITRLTDFRAFYDDEAAARASPAGA